MKKKLLAKLSLGKTDFESLRKSKQIYVDRTDLIWDLATKEKGFFYLSRPDKFGKSLLLSTFESLFKYGLRDFEGLKIETKGWEEKAYSTVRLDFAKLLPFSSFEDFKEKLENHLVDAFSASGFSLESQSNRSVLEQISTYLQDLPKESLVVLIDNCDKPLRATLSQPITFQEIQAELTKFYTLINYERKALRFLFITGVLHFGKEDALNVLDDLEDISTVPQYCYLLGFTDKDIKKYYSSPLMSLEHFLVPDRDGGIITALTTLQKFFGGYAFSEISKNSLFIPGEVLNFLANPTRNEGYQGPMKEANEHWLKEVLGEKAFRDPTEYLLFKTFTLPQLCDCGVPPDFKSLIFLYQMGYLTIVPKSCQERTGPGIIHLAYPNKEMAYWFAKLYIEALLSKKEEFESSVAATLLKAEDYEHFLACVNKSLLAISNSAKSSMDEDYLLAAIMIVLRGAGITTELVSSNERSLKFLKIRIGSDRWIVGINMKVADEDTSLSSEIIAEKLKEFRMRGMAVKKIKILLEFSETSRQFVKLEVVDSEFNDPVGLILCGGLHNPTEIGPRVYPDYANYFRKWLKRQ